MNFSNLFSFLTFGILIIFSVGCNSSQNIGNTTSSKSTPNTINPTDSDRANGQLIDMLRRVPGLNITGNSSNPQIVIRGQKSIVGDNNPLFVLDGIPIGRSYRDAASSVNTLNIESIKIVKGSNAAMYGARGGMGVIEIYTKKR